MAELVESARLEIECTANKRYRGFKSHSLRHAMINYMCFEIVLLDISIEINLGGTMKRLKNIHPGEILKEEFLEPLNISAYRLAKETHHDQTRISEIIHQKRRITADTALRLAKFFGNSPQFWLGLQNDYDIEEEKTNKNAELNKIHQLQVV